MTKSNTCLTVCLIFIGGLFVVSVFEISPFWGFLFSLPNFAEAETQFDGLVVKEPIVAENSLKLVVQKTDEQKSKILIITEKYPHYNYGDKLGIIGFRKKPENFAQFDYQGYLAKNDIYSVIYYPKIKLESINNGSFLLRTLFNFKNSVKNNIERIMPRPEVAVLEALELGDKGGLSDEFKEKLNLTGTRHIVAISGMHIVILSNILMFILIGLGFWRGQAFYFTLGLLTLFIIMIGAPASAVRAGVMGGVLLLSRKIGRLSSSGRAIVFVATIMLIINPLLLKFDIGFQLSFLAALGIIYIKPIFDERMNKILPDRFNSWLRKGKFRKEMKGAAIMTLAAQFSTLPILVYNFGRISFISLLANILIVPAIPYIMGAGLIFSLIAVISPFLGLILIWPMWFMLAFITKLVNLLSKIPFAAYEIFNVHWAWLVAYYILLTSFTIWRKNKTLI